MTLTPNILKYVTHAVRVVVSELASANARVSLRRVASVCLWKEGLMNDDRANVQPGVLVESVNAGSFR